MQGKTLGYSHCLFPTAFTAEMQYPCKLPHSSDPPDPGWATDHRVVNEKLGGEGANGASGVRWRPGSCSRCSP